MNINKDNIELTYEVSKLQSKINLCTTVVKSIDNKLLNLKLHKNNDLDNISEKIGDVRNNLRDLADFLCKE